MQRAMNQTRRRRPQGPARKPPRQGQMAMRRLDQQVIPHPPQIGGYQVNHATLLRFQTNAVVDTFITFQNLLDTLLMATSAVAGFDLFRLVKIRKVEIWAVPVIGNATSITLQYNGVTAGAVGDQQLHTDTSMGIQPAHVSARPSPRCLAADFQPSSSAAAFSLTCPAGSVVDVSLSFRGAFATPVAVQNALVAASVGGVYLRGLDGLAKATSEFVPPDTDYWI